MQRIKVKIKVILTGTSFVTNLSIAPVVSISASSLSACLDFK